MFITRLFRYENNNYIHCRSESLIMSYASNLTQYRTFTQHGVQCGDCTDFRLPTFQHVPQLHEELRKNRMKSSVTEIKVRNISATVADLEQKARDASKKGNVGYKYQLTYRLSIQAGYLHMMLRYALLLKQDNRRLLFLLRQAWQSEPLPSVSFINNAEELFMVTSAPDVGALIMRAFYPPMTALEEEEEGGPSGETPVEYSIITELFSAFSFN